jgi:chromosome segregation ATPase
MSSRLADSLELCYDLRGALKEVRAGHGEIENVLDSIFNDLPGRIEGIAVLQSEAEQNAAAHREEAERFQQQIAAVLDQLTLVQREQAVHTAELESTREENAALANELAEQRQQSQHWQDVARQKQAEVEAIAVQWREAEETTAADHRQETERLCQQIATMGNQLALFERDQVARTAELQSALGQTAATAGELVEQKRKTQHWQELAQQKEAEVAAAAAKQCDYEQTIAEHRQETDQLLHQIALLADQQTLVDSQQAEQAAELQTARVQNAAIADELAEQRRQAQRWQNTALQKQAEIEEIAACQSETEQTIAASHRQVTDQLRQQIAELVERQAVVERDREAQAA